MDSGIQKRTWRNSPWTAVVVFPLLCVSLLAVLVPWAVRRSYRQSAQRACVSNLKQIDGAQMNWALEGRFNGRTNFYSDGDLFGPSQYIPKKPTCPAGGIYTLGSASLKTYQKPRCSVPSHTI